MKVIFLLLFLLWKVLVTWSIPPLIDGGDQLIINETTSLTLRCQGSKPLEWKPISLVEEEFATITSSKQNDTDYIHVSKFEIGEPIIDDTRYYSCYYNDTVYNKTDKENVDSIYVFVATEDPLVIMYAERKSVILGQTFVIDCRPTHPDINVTLKKDDSIIDGERAKFDPKVGFVMQNFSMDDEGDYFCETGSTSIKHRFTVAEPKTLPQPKINKGKNQYFVKGDPFSLECSVNALEHVKFTWSYPNEKKRYVTLDLENETTEYKSILKVPKASEADTGIYSCFINSSFNNPNNFSTYINVKETMKSFLNITSSKRIKATEGEKQIWTKWKTELKYYPPAIPNITYTNWTGQKLENSSNIIIEYDDVEKHSWLKIANITWNYFGNYTINLTTIDGAATKSTTVLFQVKSAPLMTVELIPSKFITKGDSLNVTCSAKGFPIADISLQFQSCSNGDATCSSSSDIKAIKEETHYPAPGNIVRKSLTFSPNTSGLLWCEGNNEQGYSNTSAIIQISDIDGIFVLRHFGQDGKTTEAEDQDHAFISVVENDDFTLLCGGSKFNYSKVELKHSPQFDSPVQVLRNDTEFSWQKKILPTNTTKVHAGNYKCTAHPHGEGSLKKVKSINITVLDQEGVKFTNGYNMKNKTEVVKEFEFFHLKCFVTGTPKPTIHWMKDNKNLTTMFKDEVKISSDSQELIFKHVYKNYTGRYTCTATNRLNKVTGYLILRFPVGGDLNMTVKWSLAIAFVGFTLIVIVTVGFLLNRVKKEQRIRKSFKELKRDLFVKGNIDMLSNDCTADKQAEMLPYDKKNWEMPRQNITLGKQLGAGAFGRVIKATVTGLEGLATTTVAIKMSKSEVDASQTRALISELKIMIHLGKHLNIVNLMGANTEEISTGELWILVEYCRFGNLLEFMKRHHRKFTNQICPETGELNHYMVPCFPMSPSVSEDYQPTSAVDQDGYLAPSAQKFVLSDPPLGHSTGTVPSSTVLTSASENSIPQGTAVNNPLYSMGIASATENVKEELEDSEDSRKPNQLQRKGSRLLSIGSVSLSDSSSVNHPLKSPDINMQQFFTHSPFFPTDTHFMAESRTDFILEVGNIPGVTAPFSTSDLICWGWQIANGMEYLTTRKILHGDLAARNLLLADKNVVKISDFGLSRNMYRNNNYVKKGDDMLPVMWMSIEAIRSATFSIESDVWAFGITLWEIFSLGNTPYGCMKFDDDFVQKLEEGYRMSCPKYANQEIYSIMKKCWEKCPLERPSFSQLVEELGHMVMPDSKQEYLSQNDMYVQMNMERFREQTDYLNMMACPNFENSTMPAETDISQYVNIPNQTRKSDSIGRQFPDTAVDTNAGSPSPSSSNLSPGGSDYLAMNSFKLQSPSSDVMSPHPGTQSRFQFSSSNPESSKLMPLPEENQKLMRHETEDPSENSAMSSKRSSEENILQQSKDLSPVDTNYVNL